jgi:hypothetical protein
MAKKRAVSRPEKPSSEGEQAVTRKQATHKGNSVRAKSGLAAKNSHKTIAHEQGARTTKPKGVHHRRVREERALAMSAPEGRPELEAVPAPQYDRFCDVLAELAESELSNTDPEVWFMGLYYGPPSNPNDVFMLWVTQQSSGGRFNARPILDAIKTPIQRVTLDDDESFIQYVVDVETLAGVLKQGRAGNHPDAEVIDSLIDAIRAERYHIMLPKNPSNTALAVANAVAPLTEQLAAEARRSKANNRRPKSHRNSARS